MVAKRIPNPQDEVRFLSILLVVRVQLICSRSTDLGLCRRRRACFASRLSRSVTEQVHGSSIAAELRRGAFATAARWPCTSLVSRRIRFDPERWL